MQRVRNQSLANDPSLLAQRICPRLHVTEQDMEQVLGEQIEFETTCVIGEYLKITKE